MSEAARGGGARRPSPASLSGGMQRVAWLLATWFGCGKSPSAPGTVGSLGALIPLLPMVSYGVESWRWWVMGALVGMTLPGIWAATAHARWRGKKDPQDVVIDEVLGQWVTIACATQLNWVSVLLALLLFRLFDVLKPPPVRQLEKLPEGTGIVADDLFAGVYAGLVLYLAGCFNLY